MKYRIKKATLLIVVPVFLIGGTLWWYARDVKGGEYLARAAKLELSDPEADARRATEQHDFRFMGVMGLELHLPGVPGDGHTLWKRSEVKIIEGTSDAYENPAHGYFVGVASAYARSYNQFLIKAGFYPTVVQPELPPSEPVCVESGAGNSLRWGIAVPQFAGVTLSGASTVPANLNWEVDRVGCVTYPGASTRKAICGSDGGEAAVVEMVGCFQ